MKKKSNTPRRKKMKKGARLISGKEWIKKYEGKNIVKGYARWYGTSKLTAVEELKTLGIMIDEAYIRQLKMTEDGIIKRNREKKEQKALLKKIEKDELDILIEYAEEHYSFNPIVNEIEKYTADKKYSKIAVCDDDKIPF